MLTVVALVVGFPVSLLLLPLLLPVSGLAIAQARVARQVWRGRMGALPRFLALCLTVVLFGAFLAGPFIATLDLYGIADKPDWPAAALSAACALRARSLVASASRKQLLQPRVIATLATAVLLSALAVLFTLPTPA